VAEPPHHPVGTVTGRTLVGRYQLDQLLAAGGMGEVWTGTDLVLGRRVAVKLLRPELAADPRLVARFRREAVAAARLSHPSIVAVYDTVSDGGTEAVVMQLVKGRSLRQVLDDRTRLEPSAVRRIGVALSHALDAAHRAGVVHRDVKPGNVLLTPDRHVLLADFGLAKVLDSDDGLSYPRAMVGTAKYLAPEQVEGRPVDGRADLYALGVVLYECLTGRVPFRGATDADTAKARLEREAAPVRSLRPGVPKPLADIVDGLLARDPDRRPSSAAVVADELTRLVLPGAEQERPLPVQPANTPDRRLVDATPSGPIQSRKPAKRNSRRIVATAALILAVAGALVVASLFFTPNHSGDGPVQAVAGSAPKDSTSAAPTTIASPTTSTRTGVAHIVSAGEFDPPPDGDGKENPSKIGYLTDGDVDTVWSSVCYTSASFAPKDGVGVVLELSAAASGNTLDVTSPSDGWAAEVYVADRPATRLTGWGEPVASREKIAEGHVQFSLGTKMGRYVLVMVRHAAKSSTCTGRYPYQARIADIAVTDNR
jgi:eukaryotic-like serine/threonine-protein kinase